jgi:lysozyme family protein
VKFEQLKDEYAQLWASMAVRTSFKPALDASAKTIIANRERYQAVAEMTKVPWYVIGLIHQMEAGCSFGCHLHNGDSLARKTVQVPANRPVSGQGPFKWEASACDALLMKSLEAVKDWTIERICFELERYNGWGYRNYHKTTLTPYLWSGTTHYARGKYVADGKWDATHVSKQTGAIALLKTLMELEPSIKPGVVEVEAAPLAPEVTAPDSFVKADGKASELGMTVKAAFGKVAIPVAVGAELAKEVAPALPVPAVPEVVTQSVANVETWKAMGGTLWTLKSWALMQPMQAGILFLVVAAIWLAPRLLPKN